MRGLNSKSPGSFSGFWAQVSHSWKWSLAILSLLFAGCSADKAHDDFNSITSELHSLSEVAGLIHGTLSLCEIDLQFLPTSNEEDHEAKPLQCEIADDLSLVEASLREIDIIDLHIKSLETESKRSYFSQVLKKEKARLSKRHELLTQGENYFEEMWSRENLEALGCKFLTPPDSIEGSDFSEKQAWSCPVPLEDSSELSLVEKRHQFLQLRQLEIQNLNYFSPGKSENMSFRLTYQTQARIENLMKALHGLSSVLSSFDAETAFEDLGLELLLPLNEVPRQDFINSLRVAVSEKSFATQLKTLAQAPHASHASWILQMENFKEDSSLEIEIRQGKVKVTLSIVEKDFDQIPQTLQNLFDQTENLREILRLAKSTPPRVSTYLNIPLSSNQGIDTLSILKKELLDVSLLESMFSQIETSKQLPLEVVLYSESLRETGAELSLREDRLLLEMDRSLISNSERAGTEIEQALRKYESSEVETLSPLFSLDLRSPVEQNGVSF